MPEVVYKPAEKIITPIEANPSPKYIRTFTEYIASIGLPFRETAYGSADATTNYDIITLASDETLYITSITMTLCYHKEIMNLIYGELASTNGYQGAIEELCRLELTDVVAGSYSFNSTATSKTFNPYFIIESGTLRLTLTNGARGCCTVEGFLVKKNQILG